MNEEERKAWEELVRWAHDSTECADKIGMVSAILAADAELTALREENKRLREAVEWALERLQMMHVISGRRHFLDCCQELEDELRRRAKEG